MRVPASEAVVAPLLRVGGLEDDVVGESSNLGVMSFAFRAPASSGVYELTVVGIEDAVGNIGEDVSLGSFEVDADAPVITQPLTALGRVRDVSLQVEVRATDTHLARVQAQLGGEAIVSCTPGEASAFACDLDLDVDEGANTIAIRAVDEVDNVATIFLPLVLDRTAPAVVDDGVFALLTPPAASGLLLAERATVGTSLLIGVALDEPTATAPVLVEPTLGLRVVSEADTGTFHQFRLNLDAAGPTALFAMAFAVEVDDVAGNNAVRDLDFGSPLLLDVEAPTAPNDDDFVLRRAPFGSLTSSSPRFEVLPQGIVPLEVGAVLVALDDAGVVLARQAVLANGEAPVLSLPSPDRTVVNLVVVDNAGNASSPTALTRGSVVISGRDLGGEIANPHTLQLLSTDRTLAAPGAGPAGSREALADDDGVSELVRGGYEWELRDESSPPAMSLASLFADPGRGTVMMVGGFASQDQDLTWRFSQQWSLVAPADPEEDGNPPKGRRFLTAYDSIRDVVVLAFGDSFNTSTKFTDVWEWNGRSWRKVILEDPEGDGDPPAQSSGAPFQHAMAFDAARGELILYQQATSGTPGTWRYTGRSWVHVEPLDPEGDGNPNLPTHAVMTWDPSRDVVMLRGDACRSGSNSFGCGGITQGVVNEQQWAWNGSSWAKDTLARPDGITTPSGRGPGIVADNDNGRVLLVGTENFVTGNPFSVWEWRGTSWQRLLRRETVDDAPHGIAPHSSAWDTFHHRLVIYAHRNDKRTWLFDDERGLTTIGAQDPEGDGDVDLRSGATAGGGDLGSRGVVFGGFNGTGSSNGFVDRWMWEGDSWTPFTGVSLPADGASVVLDVERDTVVIFGGFTGSGSTNTVVEIGADRVARIITPTDPESDGNPTPRSYVSAGYDPVRQKAVFYGGFDDEGVNSAELWEWDGASFALVALVDPEGDGAPPFAAAGRMVWSDALQALIHTGGISDVNAPSPGTWAYDGASFRRLDNDSPLDLFLHASAVMDNGDVVLFGPNANFFNTTTLDIRRFRNGVWDAFPTVDALGDGDLPGLFHPMVFFDRAREAFVGFGMLQVGSSSSNRFPRVGLLDARRPGRPMVSLRASPTAVPVGALVGDIEVRGTAGAGTGAGAVGDAGVEVRVWDIDAWRVQAPFSSGSENVPLPGSATVRLRPGPIAVALSPANDDVASLAVDSFELEVQYVRQ